MSATKRRTVWIAAGVLGLGALFGGCVAGVPLLSVLTKAADASTCGVPAAVGALPGAAPQFGRWDARQVTNAAAIVSVGRQKQVPPYGYVVALATAMQESTLLNHANANPAWPQVVRLSMALPHEAVGHDNDSVGLFQQRPVEGELGRHGWGTVSELMTPAISATKFYNALLRVPGWEHMRVTDAAQRVQKSGEPEAYQQWQQDAKDLAAHVLGLPNIDLIGGGGPAAPCGTSDIGLVAVGPGGWVQPVDKRFVICCPFGEDRGDHRHAGVDLSGANIRGEPIRAAAVGTVRRVKCNSPGTGDNCDRDGWPGAGGCGWYVDIQHPGNVATRYCHQVQRPSVVEGQTVTAGQVIGFVGTSGNSSGPHLHFEVHVHVTRATSLTYSNAVDPAVFMAAQGAPLQRG